MKNLPIGIQAFHEITDLAHHLIDSGKYYFLSRQHRFGKSLFLDTLKDIFEGKKELFEGLEPKYRVMNIPFYSLLKK